MAFMVPEYSTGPFYEVTDTRGEGTLVPAELVGSRPKPADFADYIDGTPKEAEKVKGWFVRLSAPGYMDATDWSGPFDTEQEARAHVRDFWEVDPDSGDRLGNPSAGGVLRVVGTVAVGLGLGAGLARLLLGPPA